MHDEDEGTYESLFPLNQLNLYLYFDLNPLNNTWIAESQVALPSRHRMNCTRMLYNNYQLYEWGVAVEEKEGRTYNYNHMPSMNLLFVVQHHAYPFWRCHAGC